MGYQAELLVPLCDPKRVCFAMIINVKHQMQNDSTYEALYLF
jgi:hypothetical protein